MVSKSEPGWKLEPDDQAERLYSLTLALVNTEIGLTKEEIFQAIRGYRMDLDKAGGLDGDLRSLNKKFDRDKDTLREIGVQIVPASGTNEGDSDYRYKVSRDTYIWPAGTKLSAKELQLLELAASVWNRAALLPDATQALTRLRAIADIDDEVFAETLSPRVSTVEPSFYPLKRAIAEHTPVAFVYRKADGTVATRTVEPWQLINLDGNWFLLGQDTNRGAARNFLLRRIQSKITKVKGSFNEPIRELVDSAKLELEKLLATNIAKLRIAPNSTASMHFETQNNPTGEISVNYYDLELLAEEILEFGAAVTVISPDALREQVERVLVQIVSDHA